MCTYFVQVRMCKCECVFYARTHARTHTKKLIHKITFRTTFLLNLRKLFKKFRLSTMKLFFWTPSPANTLECDIALRALRKIAKRVLSDCKDEVATLVKGRSQRKRKLEKIRQ